ncbi:type II toxin-antitoxin system prevent-host-death family antitoxin [Lipingzhangella sp. LS1_29]|uniref:Antitoxin n=1 Tax=Lipingzhangella rawalii TaxID=2055835 RepID=A0ABU2HB26_9ACTN|nr:type II toxin-antitoxin system prevent-host-death family antitoxin [Lipingzhangella rawalii]MDS1272488.1 type II toxin-antitoxin system prevent-host-death family antitoxin [Lipingzhangella rawalii]
MGAEQDHIELTVTEATRRGVAGLVADAEQGEEVVVTRRNQPVAAVVSMRRYAEMEAAQADLTDLALVLARAVHDTGERSSVDDALTAFAQSRAAPETTPVGEARAGNRAQEGG